MTTSSPTHDSVLNAKGRFGRLAYAAWSLLSAIVLCAVIFILAFIGNLFTGNTPQADDYPVLIILLFLVSYLLLIYFSFVFTIRRLHDRNQSGWLSLLMLVPLLNVIMMLYLFCAKGTDGVNKFGPVRATAPWEKVLGWIYIILIPLLIIVALVGNTVPAYQQYLQRSQQTGSL